MVKISEVTPAATERDPKENTPPAQDQKENKQTEHIIPIPIPNSNPNPNQTPYDDYAHRVAYIMRSYLLYKQHAAVHPPPPPPPPPPTKTAAESNRCKAMMEVVQKEHGKWKLSRVITEHNHPLGAADAGGELPKMDLEFDSVEAAKTFYYGYGEKIGFQARTGSNRRSSGSGNLIMQRFVCSKGSYVKSRSDSKRKRKREREQVPVPKENDVAEMIPVECSAGSDEERKAENLGKDDNAGEGKGGFEGLTMKAAKYTVQERRDVVCKYMMKRNNRQSVERNAKNTLRPIAPRLIAPRRIAPWPTALQPVVAERHQRDVAKSSTGRDKFKTSFSHQGETEAESSGQIEDDAYQGEEPNVGMVFANENKAYEFYFKYAGNVGFSVRRGWWEKFARKITRRVFVCSKEGFRPAGPKRKKSTTRTGCPARMAIQITPSGDYCVNEFVAEHNHQLAVPLNIQMLKSQTLVTKFQSRGLRNANLIPSDYKNYLRLKRTKDMQVGDAGAILEYLQKMKGDDPSFFYAIQVDEGDRLTNFFWADAINTMDYYYFGDVVCFDMSYKANDYGRPFAPFIGVNHHKQAVIFGAALLYDETLESFKWLFETFRTAMCQKQPKIIFSDQSAAIGEAVAAVWPGTNYRHCLWHIFQNTTKKLNYVIQASETFLPDFVHCIYDCEGEEFLSTWETILEKYDLKNNNWLAKLYEEKEKWAMVYMRDIFCADIQNTLRSESLNSMLKECFCSEIDLLHIFEKYEQLVDGRRYTERQADYDASKSTPRILPSRLLCQAANAYTPAVFEVFRAEFGLSMHCTIYNCEEVGTTSKYVVLLKENTKEHLVEFDSSDCSVTCTCQKFEFVGVLCSHVLKVLDFKNIKELPARYILKRWRKDAKTGSIRENHGLVHDGDSKSSIPKRYSLLCRMLYKIAAKASENVEAYAFTESNLAQNLEQVEQILQTKLLEKSSLSTASKGRQQNQVQTEKEHHGSNSDSQRVGGKKKDIASRHRHQSGMERNKQKRRKAQCNEGQVSTSSTEPLVASDGVPSSQFFTPCQFMQFQQEQYVAGHQFELGSVQDFPGMAQYNQEPSASALQQQPFTTSSHLGQDNVQACPAPGMHPLQFVSSDPQLGQPSNDQGHYSIPVWDFL